MRDDLIACESGQSWCENFWNILFVSEISFPKVLEAFKALRALKCQTHKLTITNLLFSFL